MCFNIDPDSDFELFNKLVFSANKPDTEYKASIRLVRRFFRDFFKAKNPELVKKRYTNCKISDIYQSMAETLKCKLSEELVTKDLVYYTIGILNLRNSKHLS